MKIVSLMSLAAVVLSGSAALAQSAPKTANLIPRLNAASAKFTNVQASFHKDLYEALIKQTTPQDGMIYVDRQHGAVRMGLKTTGQDARTVLYQNGSLKVYNPGVNCFNTVGAGSQTKVESALTLGFGGSGTDLEKNWIINDLGQETLTVDHRQQQVEKLDLVPRDAGVKATFTHVTVWIDPDQAISYKQESFSPTGDTQTATYSNLKTKSKVDTKSFEIPKKAVACGK